ncbi:MAG: type III-A CRISPR-associated protein Cas10/Csm1 [Desulfovibrio sp.]|nr:type III-A CRISPR-associated protein Cas10/Csm1 [Desulfovibrio sp.]
MNVFDASCRVAFAALIHDLGKFAQRAEKKDASRFPKDNLNGNITQYCPFHDKGGYHSHHHAAWTALAFDELEHAFPDVLKGDASPFASRKHGEDITDSLINAAAMHHKPSTPLQRIIAEADRTASGFEREEFEKYNARKDETDTGRNHFQARLMPLFEQILQPRALSAQDLKYRYPLQALSPASLFPEPSDVCEPSDDKVAQDEYKRLWESFTAGLEKIPASHRASWPLWLDHFDSLWTAFTHAVPSATAFGVKPDVSLYDHCKATAALAVALWRHARATGRDKEDPAPGPADPAAREEKKYLLIQGDFFGIQDFIFAEGSQTNKKAAKILRGRSFQVALLTELAALRILETLQLPPTSRVTNAAGKFLIVAHNTPEVIEQLRTLRQEFDAWFLRSTFGLAGLGLAWEAASREDFCGKRNGKSRFTLLYKKLFESLESAKYRRFDLCDRPEAVLEADFTLGVCAWNGKLPADRKDGDPSAGRNTEASPGPEDKNPAGRDVASLSDDGKGASCALSRDQIRIGESLLHHTRILVVGDEDAGKLHGTAVCELSMFGYRVMFAGDEADCGRFGELAASGALRRCWDFSLPQNMKDILWNGYARRNINGYVPYFPDEAGNAAVAKARYGEEAAAEITRKVMKSFTHIACEDREPVLHHNAGPAPYTEPDACPVKFRGIAALTVLKGDVDNLGTIFQKGLSNDETGQKPTFARLAALSRQMDAFFSVYLPVLCADEYPNAYTVFAGGDDFFLVGPWHSTQKLAGRMAAKFARYTAENPKLHFSAGMIVKKPGSPVYGLTEEAEDALKLAKKYPAGEAAYACKPAPAAAEIPAGKAQKTSVSAGAKDGREAGDGKNAFCLFGVVESWKQWHTTEKAEAEIDRLREQYRLSTGFMYSLLALLELSLDERDRPEALMWRSKLYYNTARMLESPSARQVVDDRRKALLDITETLGHNGIEQMKKAFRIPLFNHLYRQRR